jgi:hypothetical protein
MKPVRITRAHPQPLDAPLDWDRDENGHCGRLFIRLETIEGVPYMRSAWEAEQDEALFLLAGGKLILGISGNKHPVVHLAMEDLPEEFQPAVTARQMATLDGTQGVRVEMLWAVKGQGRRAFVEIDLAGRSYPEAVALGMTQLAALAEQKGWTV